MVHFLDGASKSRDSERVAPLIGVGESDGCFHLRVKKVGLQREVFGALLAFEIADAATGVESGLISTVSFSDR